MKKKLYQAGMIGAMLTFGIIAIGCVSDMGVYSLSLQAAEPDTLSHLSIDWRMGISGFNGKPVHWGFAREAKFTKIDIPAGLHSFRYEYFEQISGETTVTQYSASNYTFSYEFLPGHAYNIWAMMNSVTITDKTDRKLSKTITLRG